MTNFSLSFKKKNKKQALQSVLLEKVLRNSLASNQIFNSILQVIKFYKTSNPQIRIIICKKTYKKLKYDSATMRQENQVVMCRKSNAKNLF